MKKYLEIILLGLMMCSLSNATPIEPGVWKATSDFKVNDVPMPASESEECISGDEAKDAQATIAKELKQHGCNLTSWQTKQSKLEASVSCDSKGVKAKGTLRGNFSKKDYNLTGEAEGTLQEVIPATATLKLTGRWLKACKK